MNRTKRIKKALAKSENRRSVCDEVKQRTDVFTFRPTEIEQFLAMHYEFCFNVLAGVTEYREKKNDASGFRVLDERERNTVFMKMKGMNLKCTFSGRRIIAKSPSSAFPG